MPARFTCLLLFLCAQACVRRGESLDASMPEPVAPLPPGLHTNLTLEGTSRTFHVHIPERAPGEQRPLVFLLHGNGGSADQLLGRTGMAAPFKVWLTVASRERLFLVIPDGSRPPGGEPGWNDCRGDSTTNPQSDDVAFLLALVESVTPLGVDRARVFSTGISNGGHMSLRLAIEQPRLVRAVAAVAASMPAQSKCPPPRGPVSVLFINGTADPISPYDGGTVGSAMASRGTVLSTPASAEVFRTLNGVSEPWSSFPLPDTLGTDRCTAVDLRTRTAWPTVRLIRIQGGGHTEPSALERYSSLFLLLVGAQSGDLEMAETVWAFFAEQ